MTVRARLLLVIVVGLAVTMVAWGWVQLEVIDQLLIQQQQRRLEELADTINTYYEYFPTRRGLSALDLVLKDQVQSDARLARIDVFTIQRGLLEFVAGAGRTAYEWPETTVAAVVEMMKPQYFDLTTEAGPAMGILAPTIYQKDASVHIVGVISFSQSRLEVVSRAKVFLMISTFLLLLFIFVLITVAFDRLIGRPLNVIARTIDHFQKGRYADRIPVQRNDEIGHLADHFNEMAGEIEQVLARNEELTSHLQERIQEETLKVAQLQQEVNQLQRLATIGHLTAILAHDIGTPIHSIQGFARLLLERGGWTPDVKRKLEIIEQQAQRLHVTIQNIKKMTKPPEPRFEITTVEELLSETLPLVETQIQLAGIALTVSVEERIPPLYLDRYRVQTALLNLIQNAVEAIKGADKGGRIEVTVSADPLSGSTVISVRDDGPGIASHDLARVCEPFFSTHGEEGLRGLGLAIARDVMKLHGGELTIKSTPGEGTEAFLVFPPTRVDRYQILSEEGEPRSRP